MGEELPDSREKSREDEQLGTGLHPRQQHSEEVNEQSYLCFPYIYQKDDPATEDVCCSSKEETSCDAAELVGCDHCLEGGFRHLGLDLVAVQ